MQTASNTNFPPSFLSPFSPQNEWKETTWKNCLGGGWCCRTGKKVVFHFSLDDRAVPKLALHGPGKPKRVWMVDGGLQRRVASCLFIVTSVFHSLPTHGNYHQTLQRPIHRHPSDAGSKFWPCHFIHKLRLSTHSILLETGYAATHRQQYLSHGLSDVLCTLHTLAGECLVAIEWDCALRMSYLEAMTNKDLMEYMWSCLFHLRARVAEREAPLQSVATNIESLGPAKFPISTS